MSLVDEALVHPVPILSSLKPPKSSGTEPTAVARSDNEKSAEQPLEIPIRDGDSDVVLVDYEENDPANPLNWSPMRKWLILLAIAWMGFVR